MVFFILFLLLQDPSLGGQYRPQVFVGNKILNGVCAYESDHGRILYHKNRNGSWDVGFCMNHRGPSDERPPIPSKRASYKEAERELRYWKKMHSKFCVRHYLLTGTCGEVKYGKWRGVRNCQRKHSWWSHYNTGFRVFSKDRYGARVACFIKSGFKKCSQEKVEQTRLYLNRHIGIKDVPAV